MFNITQLFLGLGLLGWVITGVLFCIWLAVIHFMGKFSEKRWGDRESGALIGFFVPGSFIIVMLYLL